MKNCCAALLALFVLAGGSCMKPPAGDFCDVAKPPLFGSEASATWMSIHDPLHVKNDLATLEYGRQNCPEGWENV